MIMKKRKLERIARSKSQIIVIWCLWQSFCYNLHHNKTRKQLMTFYKNYWDLYASIHLFSIENILVLYCQCLETAYNKHDSILYFDK